MKQPYVYIVAKRVWKLRLIEESNPEWRDLWDEISLEPPLSAIVAERDLPPFHKGEPTPFRGNSFPSQSVRNKVI